MPPETQKELYPNPQQIAMEKLLEQEEQSILHDVQSLQTNFNLRNRIRNYIENNVQLNR